MGEEGFLDNLGARAAEEVAALKAEAESRAAALRAEAAREGEKARDAVLATARRQIAVRRAGILNAARLKASRMRLTARHGVAERLLTKLAVAMARTGSGTARRPLLEALLDECVVPEGAVITCRRDDRAVLEEIAAARGLRVAFEEDEALAGGLTVRSADGRFTERNTFADRLARARPRLLQEINGDLFEREQKERAERHGR